MQGFVRKFISKPFFVAISLLRYALNMPEKQAFFVRVLVCDGTIFFPWHSNSLIGAVSRTLMQYTLREAVKLLINDTVGWKHGLSPVGPSPVLDFDKAITIPRSVSFRS